MVTVRTRSVITDDGVGEVGVQAHSRRQTQRHVGEESHAEGAQCGNGSCCGHKIPVDTLHAQHIFFIGVAQVGHALWRADARPARFRCDGGCGFIRASSICVIELSHTVDRDNVGHCEKSGEAGADFGEEVAPRASSGLRHSVRKKSIASKDSKTR